MNNVDPTGNMIAAMSMPSLLTALTIGVLLYSVVVTTQQPAFQDAMEDALRALVASTVAVVAAMGMPFKDGWEWLKNLWERSKQYFKDRGGFYFHYSYIKHAPSLLITGLWNAIMNPPFGSFATRDIYLDGWMAKGFLALPHKKPPNAIYIVWPKRGYGPTSQGIAVPKYGMPGGGYEYRFAKGSGGPLTVFGPIPIPRGSSDGFLKLPVP